MSVHSIGTCFLCTDLTFKKIPEGWEPVYSVPETDADGKVVFTVKNRRIPKEPERYRKEELDDESNEEPETDRPSGSSGGGNSVIKVTERPEQSVNEPILEPEVLGANRFTTRRIVGLPYGTIASGKIPPMGEEREDEGKRAGLLLACAFLAALAGTGFRIKMKDQGVNRNGK